MSHKKVLVSARFFDSVVELLSGLDKRQFTDSQWRLYNIIQVEITDKHIALEKRKKFTAYKTAAPGDDRDAKRIDYLIESGIGQSFRSEKEIREAEPPC